MPGEAAVAGLHVAELALDDPERMLGPGPHHGDDAVDLRVRRVQRAALGAFRSSSVKKTIQWIVFSAEHPRPCPAP